MKQEDSSSKYYFFWKHQFGQWTLKDITDVDGVVYNCCEQYMMAQKARLFGDQKSFEAITQEISPRRQQELGRVVANYNQDVWDSNKEGIVYDGNMLKFSQHKDLKQRLIETTPKILVEASPNDLVWGIGLAADNPLILDEANWRGQNLLGKVLTRVRGDLK